MSLRFRLNFLVTTILLAFMVSVGWVMINAERVSIQEGVEAASRVTVQLLDTVVISSYQNPEWGYTHLVMLSFLKSLGHVRNNEILLYDAAGRELYRSPPSKFHADDSPPPEWFVNLVAPPKMEVSRRIRFGILIVQSNPVGAIREAWNSVHKLLWIGLVFFILLNGMVYWVLGRSLKPIASILSAINRIEEGYLSARLPSFGLPEFNLIAGNLNRMASSLESSMQESGRLALIVKQTNDAIMIHDLNGNISMWNPAAERMFGYSSDEIMGQSAERLAPDARAFELKQNLQTILARRHIEHYDTQRITKDGRLIDISLSVAPLIDPIDDRLLGEICTMRDITERKQAEEAERKLEENRQFTQLIQSHIEEERRSLARELHDELGQYVTAIKSFAFAIATKARDQLPEVESSAQTIVAAANHIYDGMHNIIRHLRPGSLDNLGLVETLKDAVSGWQKQYPHVNFALSFEGELAQLGENLNINLYRIVQEAVTNALRHAQGENINIHLARDLHTVRLSIHDDGRGMAICNLGEGQHFGLVGMRERVQSLSGLFQLNSELDEGTSIEVEIPIKGIQ